MNKQPPIQTSGTQLLLWAALALRFRRAIEIALTAAPLTSIVQWFSFRAVVSILLGLGAECVSGEASPCLVATIDDGNMRLDVTCQEPREKLSTPVSFVRCQILWSNSELAHVLDHSPCCQHFLAETCRRSIDRQNHTARRVDEIVVVVSQSGRPTFDGPGGIGIGRRYHLLAIGRSSGSATGFCCSSSARYSCTV